MKHSKYNYKVYIFFVFIFLLYKICIPLSFADSCSFSAHTTTSTGTTISSHYFILEPTQCTFEMLGTHYNSLISNTTPNVTFFKYAFSFLYIIQPNYLIRHFFVNSHKIEIQGNSLKKSHFYIICYIHHKDGKKLIPSN